MKNATIAILADKIHPNSLSAAKKIHPASLSVADESAPQYNQVGLNRLPRTEAGIYPPPYPADNQPC